MGAIVLSEKEKMQIHDVVDRVVEARLLEFSEVQLTLISDMLMRMTDKYVESLMQLSRMMGLPESVGRKEADRMAAMMLQGLRKD
jgi:hypothetical protein